MKYIGLLFCCYISVTTIVQGSIFNMMRVTNDINRADISGIIDDYNSGDSIALFLFDWNTISEAEALLLPPKRIVAPILEGKFSFHILGIDSIQHFYLVRNALRINENPGGRILSSYMVESGDNVEIIFNSGRIQFRGNGSQKYCAKYRLDSLYNALEFGVELPKKASFMQLAEAIFKKSGLIRGRLLQELKRWMSPHSFAYRVMYADILGKTQYTPIYNSQINIAMGIFNSQDQYDSIRSFKKEYLEELDDNISEMEIARSIEYLEYLFKEGQVEYLLNKRRTHYLRSFLEKYPGAVRDRLLMMALIQSYNKFENIDSVFNYVIDFVDNNVYRNAIKEFHDNQKIGKPAFNFSLPDIRGQLVKMSDYLGKVVFMDFWYIGCAPCISYFQNVISKAEEKYNNSADVVFISICIESNKEKWKEAVTNGKYTSPKSINLYTSELGYESPIVKHYYISGCPKPILISKDGSIISSNMNDLGKNKLEMMIENALLKEVTSD